MYAAAAAPMEQASIVSTRTYTLERAANAKELGDALSPSLFFIKKAWNLETQVAHIPGKRLRMLLPAWPTYGEGKHHRGYGFGAVQLPVPGRLFRGSNCKNKGRIWEEGKKDSQY